MNPAAVQTHLLKTGALLNALLSESLSPETKVLAREVGASVFVLSEHVVDAVMMERGLLDMPAERDKRKEMTNG